VSPATFQDGKGWKEFTSGTKKYVNTHTTIPQHKKTRKYFHPMLVNAVGAGVKKTIEPI
jgi:hypothetical protein